jgi:hypothetical protein
MTSTAAGPDQPGLAAARTTGASVVRGGIWNLVARVLPQVYVLIISVAAARFLGADGMDAPLAGRPGAPQLALELPMKSP